MRFLLDENVPIQVLDAIRKRGHDVERVPLGSRNGEVAGLASREKRILLTYDKDFLDARRYPPAQYWGIVCLRLHPPILKEIESALEHVLKASEDSLKGAAFFLTSAGLEPAAP